MKTYELMTSKKGRIVLWVLSAAIIIAIWSVLPRTAIAADELSFASWEEAAKSAELGIDYFVIDNDYTIITATGLAWVADQVNSGTDNFAGKTVTLVNDIELDSGVVDGYSDFDKLTEKNSWMPIGTTYRIFEGIFDGDGHTVSGVKINITNIQENTHFALLGRISQSAVVKNTGVIDSSIHVYANSYISGIVGENSGTIQNCYSSAELAASSEEYSIFRIGGVAGVNSGTVMNCYNWGNITIGNGTKFTVGGVIGNNMGNVEICYNAGQLPVGDQYGSVVGIDNGTVVNCYYLQRNAKYGIGSKEDVEGKAQYASNRDQLAIDLNKWVARKQDFTLRHWESTEYLGPTFMKLAWETVADAALIEFDYSITGDEYMIYSGKGLAWLAGQVNTGINNFAGKTVTLANDINLDSGLVDKYTYMAMVNNFNSWIPIGTEQNKFAGTFDGNNHTVSGMKINVYGESGWKFGLFGCISETAKISNLGVINSLIYTKIYSDKENPVHMGGIVATNYGIIQNSYSQCPMESGYESVSKNSNTVMGGITGRNRGAIDNCYSKGAINGKDRTNVVSGGIAGINEGGIQNCYNTGKLTASNNWKVNVGGVAGENGGTVRNCYNVGNLSIENNQNVMMGGVVGENINVVGICYNGGDIVSKSNPGALIGGVMGKNYSLQQISKCYYKAEAASVGIGSSGTDTPNKTEKKPDAWLKSVDFTILLNSIVEGQPDGLYSFKSVENSYPILVNEYRTWEKLGNTAQDGIDYMMIDDSYNIITATGLAWIVNQVNANPESFKNKTVMLNNDIDLDCGLVIDYDKSSKIYYLNTWKPIRQFYGTFDGNGYTVSGMKIVPPLYPDKGESYGFIANVMSDAVVKNVGFINAQVSAVLENISGVAGVNNGTIQNCYFNGSVTGSGEKSNIGSITGKNGGTVQNCYSNGAIQADAAQTYSGGIVGNNEKEGRVQNVYFSGSVKAADHTSKTGGIAGYDQNGVLRSYYKEDSCDTGIGNEVKDTDAKSKKMSDTDMRSNDFVDTLNAWVIEQKDDFSLYAWVYVPDSYPILFPMECAPDQPVIIEGTNKSWELGSTSGLTFSTDGNIQDFLNVVIDGQVIDESHYVKTEGSMAVTLNPAFLGTLSLGEHYIEINFTNGTASTTFTIIPAVAGGASNQPSDLKKAMSSDNPKTGDKSNMAIYIVLLLVSGGAGTMFGVAAKRGKRKQ